MEEGSVNFVTMNGDVVLSGDVDNLLQRLAFKDGSCWILRIAKEELVRIIVGQIEVISSFLT